jgi:hypothetical protein
MRFIAAMVSISLFSWLGYLVYTDRFTDTFASGTGGGKAQMLLDFVARMNEDYGVAMTALGLVGLGMLVSFLVIAFGRRAA